MPGPSLPLAALSLTLLAMALVLCAPTRSVAQEVAPEGFFGVNASSNDPADFGGMAAADVGVTRTVFPFQVIRQGRKKPYNWSYSDNIVANTTANGLDLIPMLYGAPPWISEELSRTPLNGEAKDAWRDLLVAIVQRYGPGGVYWAENPYTPYRPIETWQIWNEPNSITWWAPRPRPLEYATLLRRSADAIHSVDANAVIMTAGIVARPTNPHAINGKKFLGKLFGADGVNEAADAVAYHPYAPSVPGVKHQLEEARSVLGSRGAGATPIWITEIGWGTKGPRSHPLIKSLDGQNRAMRETFEMVLNQRQPLGLGGLLWYQWRDRREDLCLWCETSGLVDRDSQPKRLFETFRQIAVR